MLIKMRGYVKPVMHKVIIGEAHRLRGLMLGKEGIESPSLKANSPATIARKGSSKPLINSGTLRAAIGVIKTEGGAFVGVRRKTGKGSKGKFTSIVNLAMIHEKGATITQIVTPKQRRFFIANSLKMFGEVRAPAVGSTIIIRIPARPFITPVLDTHADPSVLGPIIARRYAYELSKATNLPFKRKR